MAGLCKICGKKESSNLCKNCGRRVCGDCFDRDFGLCLECSGETKRDFLEISPGTMVRLGTALIFGGFGLMILGSILGAILGTTEGFVLVGVFPFLFGYGASPPLLSLVSLMMVLLPLAFFLYPWIRSRTELEEREEIIVDREGSKVIGSLRPERRIREREEEQIIAVSVPEHVQRDLSIQIVGDKLIIKGKEDETFRKSYSFPRGTKPIEFKSEYIEDHRLLVIRTKVRREEISTEK